MKRVLAILLVVLIGVGCAAYKIHSFQPNYDFEVTAEVVSPDLSEVIKSSENESISLSVNDRLIASSRGDQVRPIASTAKMILALAIIDAKPFAPDEDGEILTYTQRDVDNYNYQVDSGGSRTAVQLGETITERQALEAVLISSSNNLADSLAQWAFGSQDNYRAHATKLLTDAGINHTTIGDDASGLSANTTSTTNDLAKIGQLLLKNPTLAQIVREKSAEIPIQGEITNSNILLERNSAIVGVKTGYTGAAGSCFVLAAKDNSNTVIIAILGATGDDSAAAAGRAYRLYNQALAATRRQTLVEDGAVVGKINVPWSEQSTPIYAGQEITADLWSKDDLKITVKPQANFAGQAGIVGQISVQTRDQTQTAPASIRDSMPEPSWFYKLFH